MSSPVSTGMGDCLWASYHLTV